MWDCDDRSYSYYVEVSVNHLDWELICDRSRERCKSWQTITFPRRPVVYVKIVGTYNTANEVFHCVHFECPSMTSLPSESSAAAAANSAPKREVSSGSDSKSDSSSLSGSEDESVEANADSVSEAGASSRRSANSVIVGASGGAAAAGVLQ